MLVESGALRPCPTPAAEAEVGRGTCGTRESLEPTIRGIVQRSGQPAAATRPWIVLLVFVGALLDFLQNGRSTPEMR